MSLIKVDCHTHTISSGHAYSTLQENLESAITGGLEGLAVTDHGPAMPGGPHEIYFMNLRSLPREYKGLRLLRGVEANIIDYKGKIDINKYPLKTLDFCIASYHEICIKPGSVSDHTVGWLAVIENPYINLLGHPGRGRFPFDIETVVKACKTYNKAIEINNHTLSRSIDREFCQEIALACKEHGVYIMVNSDAHFSPLIGQVSKAEEMLNSIDFPNELIANRDLKSLDLFLKKN